jgi:hypothetical protein
MLYWIALVEFPVTVSVTWTVKLMVWAVEGTGVALMPIKEPLVK